MTAGRRILLLSLLLPCVLQGCRSNDLVENELRTKEALYRDTLQELKRIEAQNEALQREIGSIRQAAPGSPILPPEIAAPTFGLKRISLGRGTGGYDNDNLPGDEALQVVIEPRDGDDQVVKVPGSLHVSAIEINPQGLKRPLCWWAFTPEQLRPHWKQGLLSTGYSIVLPWTVFPQYEGVRVVVQFKLSDGRCFEADKDVKVRLLPIGARPSDPAPGVTPPAPAPAPGPGSFIIPSSGIQEHAGTGLHWSPAPDGVTPAGVVPSNVGPEGVAPAGVMIGRPVPLSGATEPLPVPGVPFDPVPLRDH